MIFKESFKLQSTHRAVSFHDITDQVKEIAARSGIRDGIVVVYSHHNEQKEESDSPSPYECCCGHDHLHEEAPEGEEAPSEQPV